MGIWLAVDVSRRFEYCLHEMFYHLSREDYLKYELWIYFIYCSHTDSLAWHSPFLWNRADDLQAFMSEMRESSYLFKTRVLEERGNVICRRIGLVGKSNLARARGLKSYEYLLDCFVSSKYVEL